MSTLNENTGAGSSGLMEIWRQLDDAKAEAEKLIADGAEMIRAGSAFSGMPVKKVLQERFKDELGVKGVDVPLYIHPDNPDKTSVRAGKAGASWLKDELTNGKVLQDFLNPEHKDYEKYREKLEKDSSGNNQLKVDADSENELAKEQQKKELQEKLKNLDATTENVSAG
ncbi:Uncharacterised protein [Halioglobus japonicus]|nr:Uncharacterised protein [Halioglobus japonicus]